MLKFTSAIFLAFFIADDLDRLAKDLKSKDAKVRMRAVEAIEEKGEAAAPIARNLCDAILDRDARIGKAALLAIEKVSPKLYAPLTAFLLNEAGKQYLGVEEMTKLKGEASPAIGVLIARYASSTSKEQILAALEIIGPEDQSVVKFFKSFSLQSPESDDWTIWFHRNRGVTFLVKWAGEDEKKRKEVYPYLKFAFTSMAKMKGKNEASSPVKCIELLGEYGALSKELLPAIKTLKLSDDMAIRKAASESVKKIETALKP